MLKEATDPHEVAVLQKELALADAGVKGWEGGVAAGK
jgi:hypothetical protein